MVYKFKFHNSILKIFHFSYKRLIYPLFFRMFVYLSTTLLIEYNYPWYPFDHDSDLSTMSLMSDTDDEINLDNEK